MNGWNRFKTKKEAAKFKVWCKQHGYQARINSPRTQMNPTGEWEVRYQEWRPRKPRLMVDGTVQEKANGYKLLLLAAYDREKAIAFLRELKEKKRKRRCR